MSIAPLLEISNLAVTFKTPRGNICALDGVDLRVEPGEFMGLVGESGSGKSVMLKAVLRLLHKDAQVSGAVVWRGENILAASEARMRALRGGTIGMIFQEPMTALNPVLTIGTQIDETLVAHDAMSARQRKTRAIDLLGLVGIAAPQERLANYPHEFSGGMRQRAMIAIALAAQPALLLADEPTTALDVTIQDQILKLLQRLARELGMAVVLVTHDLGVVAQTCDRVAVMYAGRIMETGTVQALFDDPRHAYSHALLRAMPHGGTAHTQLATIPGLPPRLDKPAAGCAFLPRCSFAEAGCAFRPPLVEVEPGHASACLAARRLPGWEAAP